MGLISNSGLGMALYHVFHNISESDYELTKTINDAERDFRRGSLGFAKYGIEKVEESLQGCQGRFRDYLTQRLGKIQNKMRKRIEMLEARKQRDEKERDGLMDAQDYHREPSGLI